MPVQLADLADDKMMVYRVLCKKDHARLVRMVASGRINSKEDVKVFQTWIIESRFGDHNVMMKALEELAKKKGLALEPLPNPPPPVAPPPPATSPLYKILKHVTKGGEPRAVYSSVAIELGIHAAGLSDRALHREVMMAVHPDRNPPHEHNLATEITQRLLAMKFGLAE